ncbi:MAG: DUF1249 domain-containing protein [Ferrimonas sp.]
MKPRRYRPDLSQLHRLFSANYRHLTRLLNQAEGRLGRQDEYQWRHQQQAIELHLVVQQQTVYTEIIQLRRCAPNMPLVRDPKLEVRLYHDARLAEVLTGQQFSRFLPVYPYPNAAMLQPDEKFQVNLYLAELLNQFDINEWCLLGTVDLD